jgi:hypothetical protein
MDEALRTKLHNLTEPLELCDEAGQVVARVVPVHVQSEYEPCEPLISEEEIQRREKSDKWYTTQQVLTHLRSLS